MVVFPSYWLLQLSCEYFKPLFKLFFVSTQLETDEEEIMYIFYFIIIIFFKMLLLVFVIVVLNISIIAKVVITKVFSFFYFLQHVEFFLFLFPFFLCNCNRDLSSSSCMHLLISNSMMFRQHHHTLAVVCYITCMQNIYMSSFLLLRNLSITCLNDMSLFVAVAIC